MQAEPTPRWTPLVERCHFPAPGAAVTVAWSGGPDSTGLLLLAIDAGLSVSAVHVDHGLRPESAADAEALVRRAEGLAIPLEVIRVDLVDGPDLEQRARRVRLAAIGLDAMTGHTMDDQAETVLLNLVRGSGPDGLAAMRPGHRHPVLELRRRELAAVCVEAGVPVLLDPSNEAPRFRRNRMRHEVLPLLGDITDADPVPGLARVADHQRQVVDHLLAEAAGLDPADTAALRDAPPLVAAVALRAWLRDDDGHPPSTAELGRVRAVVDLEVRAAEISGGRRVARTDGRLRIERDR